MLYYAMLCYAMLWLLVWLVTIIHATRAMVKQGSTRKQSP